MYTRHRKERHFGRNVGGKGTKETRPCDKEAGRGGLDEGACARHEDQRAKPKERGAETMRHLNLDSSGIFHSRSFIGRSSLMGLGLDHQGPRRQMVPARCPAWHVVRCMSFAPMYSRHNCSIMAEVEASIGVRLPPPSSSRSAIF